MSHNLDYKHYQYGSSSGFHEFAQSFTTRAENTGNIVEQAEEVGKESAMPYQDKSRESKA